MGAGQAGMALHTMAIQAYQADVLKEMDEGDRLTPEAVKELRKATDLALQATKHTARAVGGSMAGSVARGWPLPHRRPHMRVDLKWPDRPSASAQ